MYKTITDQVEFLKSIHMRLQEQSTSGYRILDHWSKIFKTVSKFFLIMIVGGALMMLLYPMIYYWFTGNVEQIIPIMVPGIDESTRIGFVELQLVHIVWLACGACGLTSSDLTNMMLSLYSWPLAYLLVDHLDKMNRALVDTPKVANTREMRLFVWNIIRMHQEFCMYTKF